MTHFPTINSLLVELDNNPDMDGVIRTTAECGRFVANTYENEIYGLAHVIGIDLEMTKRKSFLDVTFYITAEGSTERLARFFRGVQRLAS